MKVTGIRVEFSKRLNDGNYGHEQANVQYVVDLEEGEDPDVAVREFLQRGRAEALAQLGESENYRIRSVLALPVGEATVPRDGHELIGQHCAECDRMFYSEVQPAVGGAMVCQECYEDEHEPENRADDEERETIENLP